MGLQGMAKWSEWMWQWSHGEKGSQRPERVCPSFLQWPTLPEVGLNTQLFPFLGKSALILFKNQLLFNRSHTFKVPKPPIIVILGAYYQHVTFQGHTQATAVQFLAMLIGIKLLNFIWNLSSKLFVKMQFIIIAHSDLGSTMNFLTLE